MAPSLPAACAAAEKADASRRSVAATAALLLIRGYKVFISPYFRGSCRFLPSCADYAAEAIAVHGAVRGTWLAARRLARCHPLCASGYDPVPPKSRCPAERSTPRDYRSTDPTGAIPRPISGASAV